VQARALVSIYSNLIYGISVDWFGVHASSYLVSVKHLDFLGILFLTVGFVLPINTEPTTSHIDALIVQDLKDGNLRLYEYYKQKASTHLNTDKN